MKTNYLFWIKWLKVASIIVVFFGLFMAVSSIISNTIFALFDKEINPAFFSNSEIITDAMKDFQAWQYGIGASMLVSWGILMFFLSSNPLANKEKWAWNAMVLSLFGWFCIDEPISLYFNVYFNAIFNVGFLAMFLIPLVFTRKSIS